ncbi:hypothetical protein [Schaalia hyovaginalis]|nr:hypothetical protein [Schaalia hyovaginalis]MDY2668859.1 hypothetical protein [Schaalia hyovaginalis]
MRGLDRDHAVVRRKKAANAVQNTPLGVRSRALHFRGAAATAPKVEVDW